MNWYSVAWVLLLALLSACADDQSVGVSIEVPSWAQVAPEQVRAAKKLGVVVAYEEAEIGLRFVLVPPSKSLRAFYVSTTEVNNRQYGAFDAKHRSTFNQPEQPVDMVTVDDASKFAAWIASKSTHSGYRVPTEEEWEHACRAGSTRAFAFGDQMTKAQANYSDPDAGPDSVRGRTADVGSYAANRWGLFDMHGNLWELCSGSKGQVLVRGGSWRHGMAKARSDSRQSVWTAHRDPDTGFRLVRGIEADR